MNYISIMKVFIGLVDHSRGIIQANISNIILTYETKLGHQELGYSGASGQNQIQEEQDGNRPMMLEKLL